MIAEFSREAEQWYRVPSPWANGSIHGWHVVSAAKFVETDGRLDVSVTCVDGTMFRYAASMRWKPSPGQSLSVWVDPSDLHVVELDADGSTQYVDVGDPEGHAYVHVTTLYARESTQVIDGVVHFDNLADIPVTFPLPPEIPAILFGDYLCVYRRADGDPTHVLRLGADLDPEPKSGRYAWETEREVWRGPLPADLARRLVEHAVTSWGPSQWLAWAQSEHANPASPHLN